MSKMAFPMTYVHHLKRFNEVGPQYISRARLTVENVKYPWTQNCSHSLRFIGELTEQFSASAVYLVNPSLSISNHLWQIPIKQGKFQIYLIWNDNFKQIPMRTWEQIKQRQKGLWYCRKRSPHSNGLDGKGHQCHCSEFMNIDILS